MSERNLTDSLKKLQRLLVDKAAMPGKDRAIVVAGLLLAVKEEQDSGIMLDAPDWGFMERYVAQQIGRVSQQIASMLQ